MGKFANSEDMIFHLQELKKKWNSYSFGPVDFDLMEVVEGVEVAASAFWNGDDYMRNAEGKVVGFLNFEEKKEADGGLGVTCGEMGTTFLGCTEDHELLREILLRPVVVDRLKEIGFRGVFDINCIKTKTGLVALEPTCRLGFPSTAYEFIEGIMSNVGEMLEAVAKGKSESVEIRKGWGMVMCVVAKPFPNENYAELNEDCTSLGEKLWILQDDKPTDELSPSQRKKIHLYNFFRSEEEGTYTVATKCGYLLYVTASGSSITSVRKQLIDYIRKNVYVSGMKYRQDIGVRVEPYERQLSFV
jgi:phosphoribosylamine-glycine ligase